MEYGYDTIIKNGEEHQIKVNINRFDNRSKICVTVDGEDRTSIRSNLLQYLQMEDDDIVQQVKEDYLNDRLIFGYAS